MMAELQAGCRVGACGRRRRWLRPIAFMACSALVAANADRIATGGSRRSRGVSSTAAALRRNEKTAGIRVAYAEHGPVDLADDAGDSVRDPVRTFSTLCREWGGRVVGGVGAAAAEVELGSKRLARVRCTYSLNRVCQLPALVDDEMVWVTRAGEVRPLATCEDLPTMCAVDNQCKSPESNANSRAKLESIFWPVWGLLLLCVLAILNKVRTFRHRNAQILSAGPRAVAQARAREAQRVSFWQLATNGKKRRFWLTWVVVTGCVILGSGVIIRNFLRARTLNATTDFVSTPCTITSIQHDVSRHASTKKGKTKVRFTDVFTYTFFERGKSVPFHYEERKVQGTVNADGEGDLTVWHPSFTKGETLCWKPAKPRAISDMRVIYNCTNDDCLHLRWPAEFVAVAHQEAGGLLWLVYLSFPVLCMGGVIAFGISLWLEYRHLRKGGDKARDQILASLSGHTVCVGCGMYIKNGEQDVDKCAGPWQRMGVSEGAWLTAEFSGIDDAKCRSCGVPKHCHEKQIRRSRSGNKTTTHTHYLCCDHFRHGLNLCCGCAQKHPCQRCSDRAAVSELEAKLEPLIRSGDVAEALGLLRSKKAAAVRRGPYQKKIDKIHAQLLLASNSVESQDFKPLLRDGLLDASPLGDEDWQGFPPVLCVSKITLQAAAALQNSGVKCVRVSGNPNLLYIPLEKLCCDTGSLESLECAGCPLLASPPMEVAEFGGKQVVDFIRDSVRDGGCNQILDLFLIGEGEAGKTSVMKALMNEDGNTCTKIGVDQRTVGMDRITWSTKDKEANAINLQMNDVAGQRVYLNLHELFVVSRAVYLYVWRADPNYTQTKAGPALDKIQEDVTVWLNLLQSRVPGVHVIPVVTHIDCVDEESLREQCKLVQQAFLGWESKQHVHQANMKEAVSDSFVKVESNIRSSRDDFAIIGTYLKTDASDSGRSLYQKLGNSAVAMWCDAQGKWKIGWKKGRKSLLAAGAAGHEASPDLVTSGWGDSKGFRDFKVYRGVHEDQHEGNNVPLLKVLNRGDSMRVNCLEGDGVIALRAAVLEAAKNTRGYREPLPASWIRLRDRIDEMKQDRKALTWEEYKDVACNHCGIEKRMLLTVTSFLHQTFALRYFGISYLEMQRRNFEDLVLALFKTHDAGDPVHDPRALFALLDQDGSGAISKQELEKFLRSKALNNIDSKFMMLSADSDSSGMIDHEEFLERFEAAQLHDRPGGVTSVVYLDTEWMIDILKGVIRHDHAALHEFLVAEAAGGGASGQIELLHHLRRMRVHGVIHKSLLDHDFLWPGKATDFWSRVSGDSSRTFEYERTLWQQGRCKALKNVVENDDQKQLALGLLEGFKIALPIDSSRCAFLCADLIPPHKMRTTDPRSLDLTMCEFWLEQRYVELPSGFWNMLFVELRSTCTSGSISTDMLAFFVLSSKILIIKTKVHLQSSQGSITKLLVRASTAAAFEVAKKCLAKVSKFYAGLSLWRLSEKEVSIEERSHIREPAQVLFLTAAKLFVKDPAAIAAFTETVDNFDVVFDELGGLDKALSNVDSDVITCVACLQNLRSQCNDSNADVYTGSLSLADIAARMPSFVAGILMPQYQTYLRLKKRQRLSEVKKRQIAPESFEAIDQQLQASMRRGNREDAAALLHQGADPCGGTCVVDANKHGLGDLLHEFGCLDPQLNLSADKQGEIESGTLFVRQILQQIQEPTSRADVNLSTSYVASIPSDTALSDAGLFVQTCMSALDEHFTMCRVSRAVYSPSFRFQGSAQIVLVLLDQASDVQTVVERFQELEAQGCHMIGVPLPGYDIHDYGKWWPECMPQFKKHSLFFDSRDPRETWAKTMREQLMPKAHQILEEWADSRGSGHVAVGEPSNQESRSFESIEAMRQSALVCPKCLAIGSECPGGFSWDECMLSFFAVNKDSGKGSGTQTKGTMYCFKCQGKVKVTEVLKRPIFLSYNWGHNGSTQRIAKALCERILLATEMPYWLDMDGGMGAGDEFIGEMRQGVAECDVVIIMLSDAFCNSPNCLREFIHTATLGKHVIPLLVPDKGETRCGPSGWSGLFTLGDPSWWKHAESICTCQDPDKPERKIPWEYLAAFTPIDLRQEPLTQDGSLHDGSGAENDIIVRLTSRFFKHSVPIHQLRWAEVLPGQVRASAHLENGSPC